MWLRLQALALTGRPSLELDQRHLLCLELDADENAGESATE